jgi:hypothetical protein
MERRIDLGRHVDPVLADHAGKERPAGNREILVVHVNGANLLHPAWHPSPPDRRRLRPEYRRILAMHGRDEAVRRLVRPGAGIIRERAHKIRWNMGRHALERAPGRTDDGFLWHDQSLDMRDARLLQEIKALFPVTVNARCYRAHKRESCASWGHFRVRSASSGSTPQWKRAAMPCPTLVRARRSPM